jgi:hypothetical protein
MPVFTNEDRRVLYIHTPKTGGTFIESCFKKSGYNISLLQNPKDPLLGLRNCSPQHYHADILKAIFNLKKFSLVFVTVRHPVSRMLSEFRMRTPNKEDRSSESLRLFVEKCFDTYSRNPFCYDNHIRSQVYFLTDEAIVFRQEDKYDETWRRYLEDISRKPLLLKQVSSERANQTEKGEHLSIDPQTLRMIHKFYKIDFERLNYDLNFED